MNKEIQNNNNEANSSTSEWDILSQDLQDEIAETVEDVAIEEETKAEEAEKAKAEVSELIQEVIKLRGGSESVKQGQWDNDQKAHIDANGMPTDYAHLMHYVKENPDAIETLKQERDDLLAKVEASSEDEDAYARWQEKSMVGNAENLFPDDPIAQEIASTNSLLDGESKEDFVNRIRRAAEAQRVAESGPSRMETGESQDAYNKRISEATDAAMTRENILSDFDRNRPLWPQLSKDQKAKFMKAFPRGDNETSADWQKRVEEELGAPVWMSSKAESDGKDKPEASRHTEAPSNGPEAPKGPDDSEKPEDQPADAGTKAETDKDDTAAAAEKDQSRSDYFPRPIAFASNEWYYMNRKERREAALKARAEAAAATEASKNAEGEPIASPEAAKAEEAVEAPKDTEGEPAEEKDPSEKLKAALDFFNGLTEADKILFTTGNADLLSGEDEDVVELYLKPIIESGTSLGMPIMSKRIGLESLIKHYPDYAESFQRAFEDYKEDENDAENKEVELSAEAKELESKLEGLHDLKSKLIFARARLEAKEQQLADFPKGGLFDGKTRKARKAIEAEIQQLKDTIQKTEEQLSQLEPQFHAEMRNSTITAEERLQIQRDEEEMRKYPIHGSVESAEKQYRTISGNYEAFHGDRARRKVGGAYEYIDVLSAKAQLDELRAIEKAKSEGGFASLLAKEDLEGKADNPREVYMKSIAEITAYRDESNAKLESLPEDQKEAYKEERRGKMRELATKVGEASRGFCRELAGQCSSKELGDAWAKEIAAADVQSMFFAYRKVAEIVPGIKAASAEAAKRIYSTITNPDHRKFVEDKLKQYFGADESFIAQLRGTDGEQQQGAA